MRSVATEPKTGFAGVELAASFAMFRTAMAVFKVGITLPLPFRCWEMPAMVETQGSREKAVRREGREEELDPL